ncbi:Alcohol dehydrogenase class-P [Citrus sinensis]|uniref:Alcohol dehydrogenase-like C-terminal domain-containing protein n=1 Tax=Citrus clementina TaxID=85681 RepID=V4T801_CITCL|nr:hypothetical protein CICLE_v10004052mg [Citrus x clementina]KAH9691570.1 Alcohol dehydrogenase class-P [Citrus sinensis]
MGRKPLVIEEVEVAPLEKDEVRLKILYIHPFGQKPLFPRISGHEAAGVQGALPTRHCQSEESNTGDLLRINTEKGIMTDDGQSRFSIKEKLIYNFLGTSTFGEYTVVHVGCVVKISPAAPLDEVCVLSCGISTGLGASLNGASTIVGVTLNPNRISDAKNFGVTEFVNLKDYNKPVQQVIAAMTDGRLDRRVEYTGNIQAMISAFECVHDAEELEMEKFITHSASFSEISKSFEYMLKGESLRTIICMDG